MSAPDRIGLRRVDPGAPRQQEVGFAYWRPTLGRVVMDRVFAEIVRARPPLPEPHHGESLDAYRRRLFDVFGRRPDGDRLAAPNR